MPPLAPSWMRGRTIELFIESYSNAARTVQVRGFGDSASINGDHTTNADRSLATSTIKIAELPRFLTLRTAQTSVKRGECFVKVSIQVEGTIVALLMAGYVTDTGTQAYPNGLIENAVSDRGLIRTITGTNPAAGVEVSETVPTGAIWKLQAMRIPLTTDATVANRFVQVIIDDGTTLISTSAIQAAHAASGTRQYQLGEWGYLTSISGTTLHLTTQISPFLPAGYRIRTTTTALQAGDDFGAPQMLVEEWILP